MSERDDPASPAPDDPFGPPPTGNPFGAAPPQNPFGSTPSSDPFGRGGSGGDPFGAAPVGDPFRPGLSADPYGPPPTGDPSPAADAWRQAPPAARDPFAAPPPVSAGKNAEGAIAALVLGIVGIIFCPLAAPFAWYYGRRAERLVDASGGVLDGRGEATAGKILGIVSCVLVTIAIVLFIGLIGFGVEYSTSSSSGSSSDIPTMDFPTTPPPVAPRGLTLH